MQKKLLATAVAGALALPAVAMAQSSVTVSGAINISYEQAGASGATNAVTPASTVSTFDVKNRDRMQDGNASNIRFTAVEDIGNGMQAFAQIESGVVSNANMRNDGVSNGATNVTTTQTAGGWGTRNSGVGLRGQAWGEVLIGIWDFHYNEQDIVDPQRLRGVAQGTTLSLTNTIGAAGWGTGTGSLGGLQLGGRYSNVIRYQSPNWGGFNFRAAYSRPTDNAVPTGNTPATPNISDGTKNKAFTFAPGWSNGPIVVGFSYLKDSDIVTNQTAIYASATGTNTATGAVLPLTIGSVAAGSNLTTNTSTRVFGSYTFAFGLRLGALYDQTKVSLKSSGTNFGDSEFKRNVWALPIAWTGGAHTVFATYGQASKLKGSIGQAAGAPAIDLSNVGIRPSGAAAGSAPLIMGDETGAKFYELGYHYALSKRTNVHLNYVQVKNNSLAGYDFFSNTAGMAASSFGADPRSISLGLRHAF